MWIPCPLRLRGAGTTQIKVSVLLPIHSSAASLFLPPVPTTPCLSFPLRTGCGRAHLTFRCGTLGGSGVAAAWGAGLGRQRERVSAAAGLGVRAGGGAAGGARATLPALLSRAAVMGPALASAWRPLAAEKRHRPLSTCWGPLSPPPAAPRRPRGTPQIQEWFGPQPHRCLFREPRSHTARDTPSPAPSQPLKGPGAEPRPQPSPANGRRLPGAHLHFRELPPNSKAAPASPPEGRRSRRTAPLQGPKDGGKRFPRGR